MRLVTTVLSALVLIAVGVVGALAVGGSGTVDPPPRIVFLANGINPADAVAGGSIAGQLGAPVFTTRPDVLEDAARTGILAYEPELVIVLGGPVAIADSVLASLSDASGLPIVPASTEAPSGGITRVAGETRYDTAAAVADLVAAYAPAYLPVGATALGAQDAATADTADDSGLLDGLDSTDFLRAGTVTVASANDWHPARASQCGIFDGGRPVVRDADGDVLPHPNTAEFGTCYQTRLTPPTDHGQSLVLDAVTFCWQGPRPVELLQLVTRDATGAAEVLVVDDTSHDHTTAACVDLTVPEADRTAGVTTLVAAFNPGATAETRPISVTGTWSP